MSDKDPIRSRLTQLVEELLSKPASGSAEDTRARIKDVFKNKLLPYLKPAISTLGDADTQALVKFLAIVRSRYDLAEVRLKELFVTVFPLLPLVLSRAGKGVYGKAIGLMTDVASDICLKGSCEMFLSGICGFLGGLQEIWCRELPCEIQFLPDMLSGGDKITVRSHSEVLVLAAAVLQCAAPVYQRVPSSRLHSSLAATCAFFARTAFSHPLIDVILDTLALIVPRLPVVTYSPASPVLPVCSLVLQLACSDKLEGISQSAFFYRGSLIGTQQEADRSGVHAASATQTKAGEILMQCLAHDASSIRSAFNTDSVVILVSGLTKWDSRPSVVQAGLRFYLKTLACKSDSSVGQTIEMSSLGKLCHGVWGLETLSSCVREVVTELTTDVMRAALMQTAVLSTDMLSSVTQTKRRRISKHTDADREVTLQTFFGPCNTVGSPLISAILSSAASTDPATLSHVLAILSKLTDLMPSHPEGYVSLCNEFSKSAAAISIRKASPRQLELTLCMLKTLLTCHPEDFFSSRDRSVILSTLHKLTKQALQGGHETFAPYALKALEGLPSELAEERLGVVVGVIERGVGVAGACDTAESILRGATCSEVVRVRAAKAVLESLKGVNRSVLMGKLSSLLPAIYSLHHTALTDDDVKPPKRSRSGSAKRRRQSIEVTATLEFPPWEPFFSTEEDHVVMMSGLRAFVELKAQSDDLLDALKECFFTDDEGIGYMGSKDPAVRDAARRLAASVITCMPDTLSLISPLPVGSPPKTGRSKNIPHPTPLEVFVTHLSASMARVTDPQVVHTMALLLGTAARNVTLGDPALGLIISELVLQLKQGREIRALTMSICRQELQCLEERFGTSLAELFKRFPMVFRPLLDELPQYNADRNYTSAPLLSVVADYLDQDIPTFVVENIPGMLSWVIRTGTDGDCAPRAHQLCECIRELDEKKLQEYGLNFKSLDKTVLLTELLLVYIQPILVSILLDTEGTSWTEYFKAIKRQLTFINDTGRGNYVQALNIKGQAIVKEIVESTGKSPDFGKGVARAGRALQMLNTALISVKDSIDGKGKCPIPSNPSVQNETTRCSGAKERIKASFFSILDSIGESFSTGFSSSGHFNDVQTVLLGLRTLKGVILLLGTATEQFTSKITSTLNTCIPMLAAEAPEPHGKEIGQLLTETWVVYIDQLSHDIIVENLDSFVIAAVGMTRVSNGNAIDLLTQLHKKTHTASDEWHSVRHFIPANNEAFRPLLKAVGPPDNDEGFIGLLKGILQGLSSLSRECRRVSLLALVDLLKAHRGEMLEMCGQDEPPEIVIRLVHSLLTMTRDWDNDATVHNHAMSCLGLIGAIEPNKMSRIRSTYDVKLEDLDDETFAVRLINDYLLKTLQLPSSQAGRAPAHDKAAYCIQELLKSLRERSQRKHPRRPSEEQLSSLAEVQRYSWWQKINEEGKKKIAAYLDTKYVIVITQQRNAKEVEYNKGMPFRSWLKAWMVNLISKTMGPRGVIMQNVRNVVKDDFEMALFMLPYLVLNACMHGGHEVIDQISREICTVLSHADASPRDASEHAQVLCCLLDKVTNWKNTVEGRVQLRKVTSSSSHVSAEDEGRARKVTELLNKVPYALLARACRVTNPARALRYTEEHLRSVRSVSDSKPTMTQLSQAGARSWCDPNDLQLYQEVYSRLGERDGLLGVRHLRQQNAFQEELQEEAVDLETMGKWSDAMQRYELLMQQNPDELAYEERMLECLQSLGQYAVMVATTRNRKELRQYTAQAAWRLGNWDLVEGSLEGAGDGDRGGKGSFERGLAMGLLALRNGDLKKVSDIAYKTRDDLHTELAAACLESYHTSYKYLVKLHALTDIERAADETYKGSTQNLIAQIRLHTQLTEQTPETREVLLTVRHALCNIFKMDSEGAGSWLELAKLCRTAGFFQMAEGAVLRAERLGQGEGKEPLGLVLEHAKLLRAKGDTHNAVRLLVSTHTDKENPIEDPAYAAKMRLKAVDWASEINHLPANEVLEEYRLISKESPSEAVFLSLAKFMERMLHGSREDMTSQQAKKDSSSVKRQVGKYEELMYNIENHVPHIFKAYANSLNQGTKHLYHALPRLISLYISEITLVGQLQQDAKNEGYTSKLLLCNTTAKAISTAMNTAMKSINGATLYTSLNTLVSLLTHSNSNAVKLAGEYIRRILKLFPERAVWSLMVFQFSSRSERTAVLDHEIIQPMKASSEFKKTLALYSQAKVATTAINKLAAHKVTPGTRKVNFHEMDFYRHLKKGLPLSVVVPIQSQLNLTLPNHVVTDTEAASLFSRDEGIKGVLAEAAVMASLQNPKKVTIITTTGKTRSFLCKARDELRKDHRVMELCHITNLLLKKNPETRRRQLYTRTFAVTMTGDASGMIEWVENVRPFRSILDDLYARAGKGMKTDAIRQLHKQKDAGKITPLQVFGKILKAFPPMLHRWFAQSFVEPTTWFRARNTYTKSAAVWSMMGHIVGLGDRHAENILVDTGTGDMVHVDFAVLFDKGMSLTVPEVVRFRLTQNVVDGFGICGVEGVFRRCAELTMSVLRTNKDIVMSIMDQFIHDPCMEKTEGSELPNIARRLDGYYDEPSDLIRSNRKKRPTGGVQLGVQGQVQKLIANTTSPDNLSVVYVWWMPWY